jgi:fibronectin type 3 domain-containing protein
MIEYVARLRWQPNTANTGTISYLVYQIENGQATAIANIGAGTYEYIVRRLQATKAYRFGVTAVNSHGWESDMVEVVVQ